MKNFNIYNINSSYISQLIKLERNCFSNPWSYKAFDESFKNTNYSFFAAINYDNIVIGYIGLYKIIDQGYITNIAVDKHFRNIGVASKLLKSTITYAKNNNIKFLSLEVRASNTSAINLYRKFNFSLVGLRKNFYTNPNENAYIFTLYL